MTERDSHEALLMHSHPNPLRRYITREAHAPGLAVSEVIESVETRLEADDSGSDLDLCMFPVSQAWPAELMASPF
jgi:hypothetical protein